MTSLQNNQHGTGGYSSTPGSDQMLLGICRSLVADSSQYVGCLSQLLADVTTGLSNLEKGVFVLVSNFVV